jgi:hypothetical protein
MNIPDSIWTKGKLYGKLDGCDNRKMCGKLPVNEKSLDINLFVS